ncbi:hypothetical protein M405DRAFT_339725 [Rhizopogon salebrosus TDB-379]|nr:hypothetical protein M405DRAFT_339725 [Rhizopogon salebrosus TDB-379]
MVTSANTVEIAWGPGFGIGVVISLAMFGISFGQVVLYFRSFPNDSRRLKLGILITSLLDCLHTTGLVGIFWHVLVSCRRWASPGCQTPPNWEPLVVIITNYVITLFVQSFYVHRVWIISGRNKLVTGTIILAAFSQILFGLLCVTVIVDTGDWRAIVIYPTYPALAAGASSVCDALITISVAYFLRTERLRVHRRDNFVCQLKIVFIEAGLMSCLLSVSVVVTLSLKEPTVRQSWGSAPGPILTKAYFNSMLAVLNTRKAIRQRRLEAHGQMYELAIIRNTANTL